MADNPPGGGNGDYNGSVTWLRLQAGLIRESVSLTDSSTGSGDSPGSNTSSSVSLDSTSVMATIRDAAYNFVAKKVCNTHTHTALVERDRRDGYSFFRMQFLDRGPSHVLFVVCSYYAANALKCTKCRYADPRRH